MLESTPKSPDLGTIENPIIDSRLTKEEALRPNPDFKIPREIFERQVLIEITYMSFDKKYHRGQIVVDKEVERDVADLFNFMLKINFPMEKVIPVADPRFKFNDNLSMAANNSSAFNPRLIEGKGRPSNHTFGRAIDINPLLNPWIRKNGAIPEGAVYDEKIPGTITAESPIVEFLKKRGWRWGGEYLEEKDYQHFEKMLEEKDMELYEKIKKHQNQR